jgi:hypothetical protein
LYSGCDCSSGYSYPAAGYDSSGATTLPPPQSVESAPPPRPTDGYRYDGGPARPVAPARTPGPNPVTPPRPAGPRPATPPPPSVIDTVARRSAKPKFEYPAYGEETAPPKAGRSNLVVKVSP